MSGLELPATEEVYSVGDLTAKIKGTLDKEYSDVRVSGEISGAKHSPKGHWYFTLKDKRAEIACVCFRGRAQYLRTKPADGLAVVARGNVSVYERQGKYQLYVASLEPQGVGVLQREFERLKAKLGAEGLFDPERKRELPFMPRRVGLVTSSAGAAIADMLTVLKRRFPGLSVPSFPVVGAGRRWPARKLPRGFVLRECLGRIRHRRCRGGSLEDLWLQRGGCRARHRGCRDPRGIGCRTRNGLHDRRFRCRPARADSLGGGGARRAGGAGYPPGLSRSRAAERKGDESSA